MATAVLGPGAAAAVPRRCARSPPPTLRGCVLCCLPVAVAVACLPVVQQRKKTGVMLAFVGDPGSGKSHLFSQCAENHPIFQVHPSPSIGSPDTIGKRYC